MSSLRALQVLPFGLLAAAACSPGGFSEGPGGEGRPGGGRDGGLNFGGAGNGAPECVAPDNRGNQIDDNQNGLVDEGCGCQLNAVQLCWTGPTGRRKVGMCADGMQRCVQNGEFTTWGPCLGAVLPAIEVPDNCTDEDCDGTAVGCTGVPCTEFENCGPDGQDEDCNGAIDCADPACLSASHCANVCAAEEFGVQCADGADNNCNGGTDCADPSCATFPTCLLQPPPPAGCVRQFPFFVEAICVGGGDEDCDGAVDCADSDCMSPGNCGCGASEATCSDGADNDCDRAVDCSDTDCQVCVPGQVRWCDDPIYCRWGKQTCAPDGRWGTCVEVMDKPPGCTSTIYSASCCVMAGQCCQNYPVDDTSIGMCAGIVQCG